MHIIIDDNLYIMIHNYTFYVVLKNYIAFFVIYSADGLVSITGPKNRFLVTLDPSLYSHFKIREQDSK